MGRHGQSKFVRGTKEGWQEVQRGVKHGQSKFVRGTRRKTSAE